MQTANGTVAAELTSIDELRFGNVTARGLDAIIAPGLGPTNVIGMNLLNAARLGAGRAGHDDHGAEQPAARVAGALSLR